MTNDRRDRADDEDSFNATQKTALAQGMFHYLVREYLTCVYRFLSPEEAEKKMHELLAACVLLASQRVLDDLHMLTISQCA